MRIYGFLAAIGMAVAYSAQPSAAGTLIFTNDILGELKPCGCRTNPLGGVIRQARFLDKDVGSPRLTLDSGNLLFSTDFIPDALVDQYRLQASYVIEAMNRMGYDAATPGTKDFALGLATFKSLAEAAKFTYLSANLRDQSGDLLFPANKTFEFKEADGTETTLSVFGLSGSNLSWSKDLKASDVIEAARDQVKKLKKAGHIVVALTHQGLSEDEKLAKEVPGIDLIIGSNTQSFLQKAITVSDTVIGQSSFRNQYVGRVPFKAKLQTNQYELVPLEEKYDDPKGTLSPMAVMLAEFERKRDELNIKSSVEVPRSDAYQTFPRCAECHAQQFDFWRKTPHIQSLETLVKAKQHHNKECLLCHTVGFGEPQGFTNVTTLAVRKVQDATPPSEEFIRSEELSYFLHSLRAAPSLKSKIPFSERHPEKLVVSEQLNRLKQAWAPVQCENCHGPGGEHPFSGVYGALVKEESCLKCHTFERAPAWYTQARTLDPEIFKKKLKKIACPKGSAS